MKEYELTYIISPELKTDQAQELALKIISFIQKEGGIITKSDNPIPRTLSYQIKKQGSGFQVSVEFNFLPEKLSILEEKIKKDSRVLRYLIVIKKPAKKEKERRTPKATETRPEKEKPSFVKTTEGKTEKKVELKDIEEKLEEILKE